MSNDNAEPEIPGLPLLRAWREAHEVIGRRLIAILAAREQSAKNELERRAEILSQMLALGSLYRSMIIRVQPEMQLEIETTCMLAGAELAKKAMSKVDDQC